MTVTTENMHGEIHMHVHVHVHVHVIVVKRGIGFWLTKGIIGLILYHPYQ